MMLNIVDNKKKHKKKKKKIKKKTEGQKPQAVANETPVAEVADQQPAVRAQKRKVSEVPEGAQASKSGADTVDSKSGKGADQSASNTEAAPTFKSLGLADILVEACEAVKWTAPTPIQAESIPPALQGRDIIGVAETGSGKTGAFVLPVLNALLQTPTRLFCLVLAPTRELAFQIAETFEALGTIIDLKCTTVVGGVDSMAQSIALAKKPHVVVATPGRLVDHLENTKGFHLRSCKYLILDEADRMLSMDFEEEINQILEIIPRSRTTFLFSATMTTKVAKLQRAAMRNPVKVQVNSKYQTVKTLIQRYLFIPEKFKDCYLVYILNEFAGQTALIFTKTCNECERVTHLLRNLGFEAICLHGKMNQAARLGALQQFKSNTSSILLATDVASRGLDIPSVDLVCNFSIPTNVKDYVHRVGRTARAGRSGRALNFVTQYDVEDYQRIEKHIQQKLEAFPVNQEEVVVMLERVTEAQRFAIAQMKEIHNREGKRKGSRHNFKKKRRR